MGDAIRRVGILFSGGPAPAANAVITSAALAFLDAGIEVVGLFDGYQNLVAWTPEAGLVEGEHYKVLKAADVSSDRSRMDIILRTARANPGKPIRTLADLADPERNAALLAAYHALESLRIDALISIGGDDTLKTANFMAEIQKATSGLRPISVVHLPKTIDNDYFGIDWTFGFMTAADFAATEVRNLVADARSMSGWYVLEVMGRKAGWLTYAAGMAGGAHRVLSVEDFEDVFDADAVAEELVDLMLARAAEGKDYGVVCLAEGLAESLPDDQRPTEVDEHGNACLRTVQVGQHLAGAMERAYLARTGKKARFRDKQIGYETRCAEPRAVDVLVGCQLGVGAYRALVEEGLSGVMVSLEGQMELRYVPFAELIDPETLLTKIRMIPVGCDFHRLARALEYPTDAARSKQG
jgi:ATP-dependent phosphofructokinase / diphosphate-dependent phosphofructokinase